MVDHDYLINAIRMLHAKGWNEREVRMFFMDIIKGLHIDRTQQGEIDTDINTVYPHKGV